MADDRYKSVVINERLSMIDRLFPKAADNTYLGHPIARWLLTFYVVKSFVAGSIHMFASATRL